MVYTSLTNLETLGNLLQYIMLNILEISRFNIVGISCFKFNIVGISCFKFNILGISCLKFNIVGISCFKFNIVGIWPPGMMDHSVTWDYTPLHSRQSKSKF